jgi:hypoxanthine phosphoribosyltransferase
MLNEIKRVQETADLLFSESEVELALDEMAKQINKLFADTDLLVLCALNGGVVTAGKLLTRLTIPLTIDAINASRYKNQTTGGNIEWILKPAADLRDKTVLIIDDILDKGFTLQAISRHCLEQGASTVYSAVLIDKILGYEKPIKADFVGLLVQDSYLFGYGMDYKGYLRNAAGIYACKQENNS